MIPASANALNAVLAIPACERIPTPTKETLPIPSSIINSSYEIPCIFFVKTDSTSALSEFPTVKVKSVFPETLTFCTMTSTSMPASLTGLKMPEAIPGVSPTPCKVNFV